MKRTCEDPGADSIMQRSLTCGFSLLIAAIVIFSPVWVHPLLRNLKRVKVTLPPWNDYGKGYRDARNQKGFVLVRTLGGQYLCMKLIPGSGQIDTRNVSRSSWRPRRRQLLGRRWPVGRQVGFLT